MKALEALEGDPAALRTLGLPPSGAAPGLAEAAAGGLVQHDMGAEDSSDEGLDSEDLDYALDEPCTNCTGNMYDGVCQVGRLGIRLGKSFWHLRSPKTTKQWDIGEFNNGTNICRNICRDLAANQDVWVKPQSSAAAHAYCYLPCRIAAMTQ